MKNKASIYGQGNPQLRKIFLEAADPAKVLCVALDYAKASHTALICDGRGRVLQSSFTVENNGAGLQELLARRTECGVTSSHFTIHRMWGHV